MERFDVIIAGAGAAGLMCAALAGKRGLSVLVLDSANKPGKKILMSGGGRCNFTNIHTKPERFLCRNPHFVKSALSRFSPQDFIDLVESHNIAYHEKTLGQLFCDEKSKAILAMLLSECEQYGVRIVCKAAISVYKKTDGEFILKADGKRYKTRQWVIATGGLSIPTLGASGFGFDVARDFGLTVFDTRAGLVPFTLTGVEKQRSEKLTGVSVDAIVRFNHTDFREAILFTHRGLSGPAILQISSYWQLGERVEINLLPDCDLSHDLKSAREKGSKMQLRTLLESKLPKRLVPEFVEEALLLKRLCDLANREIDAVCASLQAWSLLPSGTEGYRTAEVTLGGVDTDQVSSKTMQAKTVPGLYFIGEVLDVTGWLGGYNFQWAWSSAYAASCAFSDI